MPTDAGDGETLVVGVDGLVDVVLGLGLRVEVALAAVEVGAGLAGDPVCSSALPTRPPDDWNRETPSAVATPMTGRGAVDVGTAEPGRLGRVGRLRPVRRSCRRVTTHRRIGRDPSGRLEPGAI